MSKNVFINETCYNTILPLQTKDTLSGDIFFTKGSITGYYSEETLRFFCAWKRKDNAAGGLDLDFGAVAIKQEERVKKLSDAEFDLCNYVRQKSRFAAHSGDWTSCRAFDYENPVITAEFIDINLDRFHKLLEDERIMFYVTSYNSRKMEDYDIYFGFIEEDKISNESDRTINLNDASFVFKIESSFDVCFLGKLTKHRIQIYGEPLNKKGCAHSDGQFTSYMESIDEYYKNHKYVNLGKLFKTICEAKGWKVWEILELGRPETMDLVITNEYCDYKNTKEIYRIFEHKDEIKEMLNSNKIF